MVRHELGKWNLDELAKNPNRAIIDKKLARIKSDSKKFEKNKKLLNPKVSSGKFLKLLHDVENIAEKVKRYRRLCIIALLRKYTIG